MSNWIPKIVYTELGTGSNKTITFSTAPEADPYNEEITTVSKKNQSSDGTSQVQWSYNKQMYSVEFKFETSANKALFQTFLTNHAYKGGVFDYYPSSDETDYETYELVNNSVKFDRPIPDGSGDFEYNFSFKMERVLDFTYVEETLGTGQIIETQFTIVNNQSSAANITGLVFDSTSVLAATISYAVQRKHTTPNSEVTETGTISIAYNSTNADWDVISRESAGDAGLTITVTSAGQLQYTSTNISGTVDTSIMRFRASTIGVAE